MKHSYSLHLIFPFVSGPRIAKFHGMDSNDTYRCVQDRYAQVARQTDPHSQKDHERKVASAFGYDLEDLRSIPENANLGVSCGNPLATANIAVVGIIPVVYES